jgi:hypothetical protein
MSVYILNENLLLKSKEKHTWIGSAKSSFISTRRLNVATVGIGTGLGGTNEKSRNTIVCVLSLPQLVPDWDEHREIFYKNFINLK